MKLKIMETVRTRGCHVVLNWSQQILKTIFFIFILFFLRSVHIILGGSRKLKFKINSIIFSVIKTKCVTTTIQL